MPRKNKRKDLTIGKEAVFFGSSAKNPEHKPQCVGCAFAGYGGVCKASDGVCLLGIAKPDWEEADNAMLER